MNEHKQSIMKQVRDIMPARPISSNEAHILAERQATELLRLLKVSHVPIPVARLSELPRVEIQVESRYNMLNKSGFSHRWENGRWLIVVNKHDMPGRRRFTLAHEFKHVLDHSIASIAYARLGRGDAKQQGRQIEHICDYFAACLLMPRMVVKRAWANGIQDTDALAGLFKVSVTAMEIRLAHLGLTDDEQPVETYFRRSRPYKGASLFGALAPETFPL